MEVHCPECGEYIAELKPLPGEGSYSYECPRCTHEFSLEIEEELPLDVETREMQEGIPEENE